MYSWFDMVIFILEKPKEWGYDFWHWELSYVLYLVQHGDLGEHEHQGGHVVQDEEIK